MAVSVSYCYGCKCFILSWLLVFHTVIRVPLFYTAMAVSVPYCHGCQCFILSGLSVFHTVMTVSVSYCHGCQCFMLLVFHIVTAFSVS